MCIDGANGLLTPVDVLAKGKDAVHQIVSFGDGIEHCGDVAGLLIQGSAGGAGILLCVHALNCGMEARRFDSWVNRSCIM